MVYSFDQPTNNDSIVVQFWRRFHQSANASGQIWSQESGGAVVEISTALYKCRRCGQSTPAIVCDHTGAGP